MANVWDNIKSALGKVAPTIGTVLGGPLGGAAASVLSSVLGVNKDSVTDPATLQAALAGANADQLLALKQADLDFKLKMQDLGFKNEKDLLALVASDRDSARQMQITSKSSIPPFLAYFVTFGFFGILAFMLFKAVPVESKDVLNIMLGALGTAWTSIIMFYFGDSYHRSKAERQEKKQ